MFRHIALIGLGLIGSSLSHVIRREGLAGHISGHARSAETREKAVGLGLVGSFQFDVPSGPMIVLVAALAFAGTLLLKSRTGHET